MGTFRLIFVIVGLLLLNSCKQHTIPKAFRPVMLDTGFSKDEKNFEAALEKLTHGLGLPSLKNGVDSFEYRFWLNAGSGPGDPINLIRIRFDSSAWIISETLIWSHLPPYPYVKGDTINHLIETVIDSTKSRNIFTNITIDQFIDSLQYYNLEQAPSRLSIRSSYAQHMDGIGHTIELAAKDHYRWFHYPCPISIHSLPDFYRLMKANFFYFLLRNLKTGFSPC